jgi:hypothetical protein
MIFVHNLHKYTVLCSRSEVDFRQALHAMSGRTGAQPGAYGTAFGANMIPADYQE